MKYALNRLVYKPKGTRVRLPIIEARYSTEQAYQRALQKMLRAVAREVTETVLPAYTLDKPKFAQDVDQSIFERLRQAIADLTRVADRTVSGILGLEAKRHTKTFTATVKKSIGIDVSAVVKDEDLTDYMSRAAQRNTSLITDLGADAAKRIEQTVLRNTIAGNSAKTLRGELTKEFGSLDNRAKLIARDQTAKMNSDLNRVRQEQAGIERYEWHTSADERVRPLHIACSGRIYRWGEPTGAENGAAPGQPILCRCVAIAIVEF